MPWEERVVAQIPPYIYLQNDGTIQRRTTYPIVPRTLEDPTTHVSSEDISSQRNLFSLPTFPSKPNPTPPKNSRFSLPSWWCLLL